MSKDGSDFPSHGLGSLYSRTWLFGFSSPAVFIAYRNEAISSETRKAERWSGVPTMVLSETRGLRLFRVVREGLGSSKRLGAQGTQRLTYQWSLTPEPECLKNSTDHLSRAKILSACDFNSIQHCRPQAKSDLEPSRFIAV